MATRFTDDIQWHEQDGGSQKDIFFEYAKRALENHTYTDMRDFYQDYELEDTLEGFSKLEEHVEEIHSE